MQLGGGSGPHHEQRVPLLRKPELVGVHWGSVVGVGQCVLVMLHNTRPLSYRSAQHSTRAACHGGDRRRSRNDVTQGRPGSREGSRSPSTRPTRATGSKQPSTAAEQQDNGGGSGCAPAGALSGAQAGQASRVELGSGNGAHTSSYLGTGRFSSRVELPIDSCSALSGVFRAVLLRLIFFCSQAGTGQQARWHSVTQRDTATPCPAVFCRCRQTLWSIEVSRVAYDCSEP